MTNIERIKNSLIDRILVTKNESFLKAIENLFVSTQNEELLSLSSVQLEMLEMSEKDIEKGDIVSDSELDKLDTQWLG